MESTELLTPELVRDDGNSMDNVNGANDVNSLDDVSVYEQERGKPMPSKRHALLQPRISAMLLSQRNVSVLTELNIVIGEKKYVPDICVYAADASDWHKEEMQMTIPPLLTVEILSPMQDLNNLISKAEIYLSGGVKASWIVHPRLETIIVLRPNEKPHFYSEGMLTDAATGISVDVGAVFT
jgi:hypothetical protein